MALAMYMARTIAGILLCAGKSTLATEASLGVTELQSWLEANGADVSAAQVVNAAALCGDCRGLAATRPVAAGETVLWIPGHLCVSRGRAEQSSLWSQWHHAIEEAELTALDDDDESDASRHASLHLRHGEGAHERTAFALFLLGERKKAGPWSKLSDFLFADIAEQRMRFSSLWVSLFPELKEALKGTMFLRMLQTEIQHLQKDFDAINSTSPEEGLSFESFAVAKSLATSRLIDTPPRPGDEPSDGARDGWDGPVLVPFVDLLNHEEAGGNVHLRFLTQAEAQLRENYVSGPDTRPSGKDAQQVNGSALGAVVVEATRAIAAGESLSWHYGWRTNDKMLLTYGFALIGRIDNQDVPMLIGPNPLTHLQGDAALKTAKAMMLAAPGGAWSHLPAASAWFGAQAAGDASAGLLPSFSDEMLTLCCASVTQRWNLATDSQSHQHIPMATLLAYLRLEQADVPLTPDSLRGTCGSDWSGWCFHPLDAPTERRALQRLRDWAAVALGHLGGSEEEDTKALAAAAAAVESKSGPANAGLHPMWYAQMMRLGERRLWTQLMQWLKTFDGLFELVDAPDLLEDYAARAFSDPETYPLHRYGREVLLPVLASERDRRKRASRSEL